MLILDHLFVVLVVLVHPVAGYVSFQRLMRRAAAGMTINRLHLYNSTLIGHWALFAVALGIWSASGRPAEKLGAALSLDSGFFVAAALTAAGIILLLRQLRRMLSATPEEFGKLRGQLREVEIILPANSAELERFAWVSLTAGIVEETLWRGYLFWYLLHFMPLWAVALVSTIGFGLAHAYQGPRNVPKVIAVGAVFALLFMLSGSIWLPMLLHAVADLLQGRLAYEVIRRSDAPAAEPPSPQ